MGTVAPNPYYTEELAEECMRTIFLPTMAAMNAEGRTFKGCLYFGLMLTKVMQAVTNETLSETEVKFRKGHACCVVMASKGYPVSYEKGFELHIPASVHDKVYVAGAKLKDGKLLTDGGRVLGCTAVADTLPDAIRGAYEIVSQIRFENAFYRHDIGARAMKALEV